MKTDTTLHASESNVQTAPVSKGSFWAGRVMSALAALFLFMDGGMKLFKPPVVVQATVQLGYPESTIVGIGIALLASTLLYVIPRTSLFGAILLTAIWVVPWRATSALLRHYSTSCSREFSLPWFGAASG